MTDRPVEAKKEIGAVANPVRCIGCGDEGHALKDCPDETEGRRLARGRASTLANLDLNRDRAKLRPIEHATLCVECGETLFGDETCESVDCPFAARSPAPPFVGYRP